MTGGTLMNQEHDTSKSERADEATKLEPRAAAALLEETKLRAQRQFDVWPPYLLLIGAAIFLLAFGAAWLSVRGQHPYVGPSGGALAVMYGGIIVWIVAVVLVVQRATNGISGRSAKGRTYRAGYLVVIIAYSLFQGALYHAGASHAIVYGIFPASAPWLFAGTVFLTFGAIREEGRAMVLGIILIAIGIGGAFAGPVAAWLVSGIGIGGVLVGFAGVQAVKRRA
jgi:hypothetical protein